MKALAGGIALTGLLLTLTTGCDALTALLVAPPTTVTVAFVNTSADFGVEVDFYYSDQDDIPRDLLIAVEDGERIFSIPAGETVSFPLLCTAAQAMIVDDSDLLILGGLGPEDDTDVLYDGDDFSCGDTITFTFSHTAAITDFAVNATAEATPTDAANANESADATEADADADATDG